MVGGGTSASISQIVITDLVAKVKKKKERQQPSVKVPRLERRLPAMRDRRKAKNGPQI